jgi:prepilin-type N-terminal cleavage/methylation domain-containing protein
LGGRSAFTLIEILLAVALLGGLLLALNLFIFSMGEIWGQGREQRLFKEHVRAVTRHVEKLLRTAALAPPVLAGTQAGLTVEEIRGVSGREPLLTFELPTGDRVLTWPEAPLPNVVCSLSAAPGEGLVIAWHARIELRFLEDPPRRTVLSPLVTGLSYDYYQPDFRSWKNELKLQRDGTGEWPLPARLRLRFGYGSMTTETTVLLPSSMSALPAF